MRSAQLAPSEKNGPSDNPGRGRIVAVGDLHGDFEATVDLLELAALIDGHDHRWVGGATTLVQLGDILDRGAGEREILDLLDRLKREARAEGGEVHVVNGNHELMNVAGQFTYVSKAGFDAFAAFDDGDRRWTAYPPSRRGRRAAFSPGQPYAKRLAQYPVVLRLDDTLFVHAGLLPKHVTIGIEELNTRAKAFLLEGERKHWGFFADWDSPLNMRHYSKSPSAGDCALLAETLKRTGTKRMVVGHTPQVRGVTAYCADQVWAIDVGVGRCCGNNRGALAIEGDRAIPLRFRPGPPPRLPNGQIMRH
ncbi:MAG: metallophosphoesterase [Myxococcota bacterium]